MFPILMIEDKFICLALKMDAIRSLIKKQKKIFNNWKQIFT